MVAKRNGKPDKRKRKKVEDKVVDAHAICACGRSDGVRMWADEIGIFCSFCNPFAAPKEEPTDGQS